jgi:hypothetical protein
MDTCLSCFKTMFQEGNGYSYGLTELGHYNRSYERLMDHWRAVLPGTIFHVRYEDVVDDMETMARRFVEFCGLPWDDACLSFHETERPVHTASVARYANPSTRLRWAAGAAMSAISVPWSRPWGPAMAMVPCKR